MSSMREAIVKSKAKTFNELDKKLQAIGDWFILYTHPYNAKMNDKNMLVFPKQVSDADFYGMVIDLVQDYADFKNRPIQNDPHLKAMIRVLEDAYDGKIKLKDKNALSSSKNV